MRGGERVLEAFCRLFPQADIYTHVAHPEALSPTLRSHPMHETLIGRLPGARRHYQKYLPLMPMALKKLDLTSYDLIISSESGPAKGFIKRPDALHLCYVHSPMRYIWDQYELYRSSAGPLAKVAMPLTAPYLRRWDVASAQDINLLVANSEFVARRVAKYWKRDAQVVNPPVDTDAFRPDPTAGKKAGFYLWVGELTAYKRPDVMVDAFNRLGHELVIIGDGDQRRSLEKRAQENIRSLGKCDFSVLRQHYQAARALIFPGEEDFGIVPVEAQAAGTPVIALGRGGALETVIEGQTGIFFKEPTAESLVAAVERFEACGLADRCSDDCIANAVRFGETRFREEICIELAKLGVKTSQSEGLRRDVASGNALSSL